MALINSITSPAEVKNLLPQPSGLKKGKVTSSQKSPLFILSSESLNHIFQHLDVNDTLEGRTVCKSLKNIVETPTIFKFLYAYSHLSESAVVAEMPFNGAKIIQDLASKTAKLNKVIRQQLPPEFHNSTISIYPFKNAIAIENVVSLLSSEIYLSPIFKLFSLTRSEHFIKQLLASGFKVTNQDFRSCILYGNSKLMELLIQTYQRQLTATGAPEPFNFELGDVLEKITNPVNTNSYGKYDDDMGQKIDCVYQLLAHGTLFHANALAYLWKQSHFDQIHIKLAETIIVDLPNAVNDEAILTLIGVEDLPEAYFKQMLEKHITKPSPDKANDFVFECVRRYPNEFLKNLTVLINHLEFTPGSKKLFPFYNISGFIKEGPTSNLLKAFGWV